MDVSSSNFPRYDRNSNTGGTIAEESEADFIPATVTLHHDQARASHVVLPVIPASAPPAPTSPALPSRPVRGTLKESVDDPQCRSADHLCGPPGR